MTNPRIVIIAALGKNNVIGKNGRLPWDQSLTEDFQHFRMRTVGRPIIMGRGTFDSLPRKPLPGRPNIVMTHDKNFAHEGVTVAHSYAEAIAAATKLATEHGEIMILGGASIYKEALPSADRMILTHVDLDVPGDTYFPAFSDTEWRAVSQEHRPGTPAIRFVVYERVKAD